LSLIIEQFLQGVCGAISRLCDSDVRAVLLVLCEWGTLEYPSERVSDVAKSILSVYEALWSRCADGPLRVSVWESLLALMERGNSALLAALIVNKQGWFPQESTRAVRAFTEIVNSHVSASLPPPDVGNSLLHRLYIRSAHDKLVDDESATLRKLKLDVYSHLTLLLPLLNSLRQELHSSTSTTTTTEKSKMENNKTNNENASAQDTQLSALVTQSVSLLHKLAHLLHPP
jgi:hypothetical protein